MTSRLHASHDIASAFTPGPWSWCECYDPTGRRLESRDIIPAGGHSLSGVAVTASVFGPLEDAHLIAAAPELYAELAETLPRNVCLTNKNVPDSTIIPLECTMGDLRRISALLAKARGES